MSKFWLPEDAACCPQEPETQELVEDIMGDFGFRLRWKYTDSWCDVEAWQIIAPAVSGPAGIVRQPHFQKRGEPTAPVFATDHDDAEHHLTGFVKWDGCCEFQLGDEQSECTQVHFCGPDDLRKHFALLEYVYKRAMELMGSVEYPW